jgi:hypothetical protein
MTGVSIEYVREPSSVRTAQTFDSSWRRMVAELAGRTVWCVSASAQSRPAADRLYARLRRAAAGGLSPRRLDLSPGEDGPDTLMRAHVVADDIVVLHGPLAASLVEPARERRSHVIWSLAMIGSDRPGTLADRAALAVDGLVGVPGGPGQRSGPVDRVAALMPHPAVLAVKEVEQGFAPGGDVAWASLLADIVRAGRDECVGGTVHARPSVAVR